MDHGVVASWKQGFASAFFRRIPSVADMQNLLSSEGRFLKSALQAQNSLYWWVKYCFFVQQYKLGGRSILFLANAVLRRLFASLSSHLLHARLAIGGVSWLVLCRRSPEEKRVVFPSRGG
jgi:hypothetical protein